MNALLLSLPLLFSSGSIGDPLRKDRLPADVDFVVHLDLEGFKATELWRLAKEGEDLHAELAELDRLVGHCQLDKKVRRGATRFILPRRVGVGVAELAELEEVEERFGLNPLTDLRAITLYKVEQEEDPTVVLLSTSAKVDAALERLRDERGYQRQSEGKIELHTWKERNQDDEMVFAYLHGSGDERVVVLASKRESARPARRNS